MSKEEKRAWIIELPLPSKKLTAQPSGRWQGKCDAIADARALAKAFALNAKNRSGGGCETGKVDVHYSFFVPDKRARDEANLIQSCKAYIDGIVDAKLIAGDDWQHLHIAGVSVEVSANPRVVLVFVEVNEKRAK